MGMAPLLGTIATMHKYGASVPDNSQVPLGAYLSPNSYSPPDLSSSRIQASTVVAFADGHTRQVPA